MPNTKLINCDQLEIALTKVKTYVDGKFALSGHNHNSLYYTQTEINTKVDALNAAINSKAGASHTHKASDINIMTGYTKAIESSAIDAADTLNAAIGKLEFKVDSKQDSGDFAQRVHTHDDRYYTESEINTKITNLQTADTNNLKAAKDYTDTKVAALVDSAPETLDTLNELSAALGDDPNFAATMATSLGNKADKGHGHSNATTSAAGFMSKDDKAKLDGIAANANNYTHPTSSGNKHIPAGGSSGQFLKWSADGTAQWAANPNTDSKVNVSADTASETLYLTAATGATTAGLKYNSGVKLNAKTGAITATTFKGALDGNAATATTASVCSGTAANANKVNQSLTIQLNGTSQGAWNGSAAKTVNITPSSIGAATTADAAKATDTEVNTMLTNIFGS